MKEILAGDELSDNHMTTELLQQQLPNLGCQQTILAENDTSEISL